jgi:two-component system cell cycle response regulator
MEETRETPVLAILEESQLTARVRALEIGVDGIISLPVHPGELLACVASRLRRKRYSDHLRQKLRQSLERAVKDPLTSMHNRRYLEQHLGRLVAQNVERERPVSLLILDVDHFKAVNDSYGHDVGDEVLREVARRITASLRGIDLACRFGGEEFVAAFSGVDAELALSIGERLRCKIADRPFPVQSDKGPLAVTISIGVATSRAGDDATTLLKRADQALYRAKKDGRNRVVADD